MSTFDKIKFPDFSECASYYKEEIEDTVVFLNSTLKEMLKDGDFHKVVKVIGGSMSRDYFDESVSVFLTLLAWPENTLEVRKHVLDESEDMEEEVMHVRFDIKDKACIRETAKMYFYPAPTSIHISTPSIFLK